MDAVYNLHNLASIYQGQGRYADAERLHERGLTIREEEYGANHPIVALSLGDLATLYEDQDLYDKAEPLRKRALDIEVNARGPDHPDVATALTNLARLYSAQGRYAEAEPLYNRSLAIEEKALGPDHAFVASSLDDLARLCLAQRDWARAANFWRRANNVIISRAQRGTPAADQAPTGKRKSAVERVSYQFRGLVKAAYHLASSDSPDAKLTDEMFQTAQWAQSSEAAQSLQQMAARGAKGDPRLAALVRERQDLVTEWQQRDGMRSAAVAQAPDKRKPEAEAANVARLAAIDGRIAEIDKRLKAGFPDYATLANPTPMSVGEVQAELAGDEALILLLAMSEWDPTPEETFLWIVTKTNAQWVRSDLGRPTLEREVAALRCGLDAALWDDEAAAAHCRDLVKGAPERDTFDNIRQETLPFDTNRAYALYKALLGPIADVIKDKHLLIVPSGALTQLPFQVLIADQPDPAVSEARAFHRGAWLVRSHTLTVLPSVSSLKALRQLAKESHASRTLIGFGNPLLDGPDARYATLAAAARSKSACAELPKDTPINN